MKQPGEVVDPARVMKENITRAVGNLRRIADKLEAGDYLEFTFKVENLFNVKRHAYCPPIMGKVYGREYTITVIPRSGP